MKKSIEIIINAIADLLLPRTCIVCGCRLNIREEHLCLHCLNEIPQTYFWMQDHNEMADRFNDMIQKNPDEYRERYAYGAALFFYRSGSDFRKIPFHIKYHGDLAAGRFFGRMLGNRLSQGRHMKDIDMIIPVPLHWTRRIKRGYNQSEIIASGVAEYLNAEIRTDILIRNRKTKTQTRLDIKGKEENVKGAFSIRSKEDIKLRNGETPVHILLLDDVFTTGSTLMACFTALRTVFPPGVRISVATLGCVVQA